MLDEIIDMLREIRGYAVDVLANTEDTLIEDKVQDIIYAVDNIHPQNYRPGIHSRIEDIRQVNSQLREKGNVEEQRADDLETDNNELKDQISDSKSEVRDLRNEVQSLGQQLESANSHVCE